MEKRLILFVVLSFVIVMTTIWMENLRRAQNRAANNAAQPADNKKPADKKPDDKKLADKKPNEPAPGDKKPPEVPAVPVPAGGPLPAEEANGIKPTWFTLGSLAAPDSPNPYEMLVTLTSRGAAIERVELSNPRFLDLENRSGYLGNLALEGPKDEKTKVVCRVNAVGAGTPAAAAGIKTGDVITGVAGQPVVEAADLFDILRTTKPDQTVEIKVLRDDKPLTLSAKLTRAPLSVIAPQLYRPGALSDNLDYVTPGQHDPFSLLLTLHSADGDVSESKDLDAELDGLHLRSGSWEGQRIDQDTVEFTRTLPKWELKIVKRFHLASKNAAANGAAPPAYNLTLHVEIQNTGQKVHAVAYQLDGPTGLPTEGWWYANQTTPGFSRYAMRNVVLKFKDQAAEWESAMPFVARQLALEEAKAAGTKPPDDEWTPLKEGAVPLSYVAVNAQYFASALLPRRPKPENWFADIRPIIVGLISKDPNARVRSRVDCTFRLTSELATLNPGDALKHDYDVFVGPKQPLLLDAYNDGPGENLGELVYYGWYGWVAKPLVAVLEVFHSLVRNYGIAILMLTVLVRLCMFPLSRKQAQSAKKMQELQPEMKRINEKFKSSPEKKTKAMQELWRKHNYNPLGGCLLLFVQLPIFMGLYRSLSVNVELRQASLLGERIRWCSNLAAPDMLWDWSNVVPAFFSSPTGWLGPFLNVLPIFTVGFFLWQQSTMMPPATDDQQATQQKMMRYMTLFMALAFYCVASGLCLYFIASSVWGLCERKLLKSTPKPT